MSMDLEALAALPGVWRGGETATALAVIATGFTELDDCLLVGDGAGDGAGDGVGNGGGGWPVGALTEICTQVPGSGEVSLVIPALAALSDGGTDDTGWIAWISPPHALYPPALAAGGVRLSRLLMAQAGDAIDVLWGMEQALRSGSCRAVLGWADKTSERSLRRLQLAAESTRAWAVLYRPAHCLEQASPAALRLRLTAVAEGLEIDVRKNRGGRPSRCRIPQEALRADRGWPRRAESQIVKE